MCVVAQNPKRESQSHLSIIFFFSLSHFSSICRSAHSFYVSVCLLLCPSLHVPFISENCTRISYSWWKSFVPWKNVSTTIAPWWTSLSTFYFLNASFADCFWVIRPRETNTIKFVYRGLSPTVCTTQSPLVFITSWGYCPRINRWRGNESKSPNYCEKLPTGS